MLLQYISVIMYLSFFSIKGKKCISIIIFKFKDDKKEEEKTTSISISPSKQSKNEWEKRKTRGKEQ